jgi:hypothetical protein
MAASLLLTAAMVPRCQASWAYVPQEIRMMQADLVVVGTITKLGNGITQNGRAYDVGVIAPTKILKGKPKKKADIRVAWPASRAGGLRVSTDITYRVGQKGVWVLTADKTRPVYWANYPTDYQPVSKLAQIRKKLAHLNNIKWGKAKNGLQVGLIVEQRDMRSANVKVNGKSVKAVARLSVYPLMKNVSDKPMQVVDHYQDRTVSITFHGPSGNPIDVNLYGTAPKQNVDPRSHSFKKVAPGQVVTMGNGYGLPICTKSGEYTITLSYKNGRDGKTLNIDHVWQGQANSSTTQVEVPAKADKK